MREVSDDELDAALAGWAERGFARLPAVADTDELRALRARIEGLIAGVLPDPGLFFQPDAPTGSYADVTFGEGYAGPDTAYRKIEKLELDPVFWSWIASPLFARVAARVHPQGTSLYRATLFSKAPLVGSDLPFHQDGGLFWGLDRQPMLQIWTALDDATPEAGCLCFAPGSHLRGLATPLGGLVPAALAVGVAEETVPARAGDVILLHNLVWHRSGPNRTEAVRRGLAISYLDAATRCRRKKHAPRTFRRVF